MIGHASPAAQPSTELPALGTNPCLEELPPETHERVLAMSSEGSGNCLLDQFVVPMTALVWSACTSQPEPQRVDVTVRANSPE
jgi:hypothetical protein